MTFTLQCDECKEKVCWKEMSVNKKGIAVCLNCNDEMDPLERAIRKSGFDYLYVTWNGDMHE